MPSPFPGMDPYLEDKAFWRDVHHSFIAYAREALQTQVRPRYHVRIEERMYVTASAREIFPDITLIERPKPPREVSVTEGRTATIAVEVECDTPITFIVPSEPITEGYLEIIDLAHGGKVVTVIELLSHTNKTKGIEGYQLYRQKQKEVLKSSTSLVEIDLLRDGDYVLAPALDWVVQKIGQSWQYIVSIHRASEPIKFYLYAVTIRQRLPRIFIPLAEDDEKVAVLDIQAVIDRCYDAGAYSDILDYRRDPPLPPFRPEDAEWIDELLKEKKLR